MSITLVAGAAEIVLDPEPEKAVDRAVEEKEPVSDFELFFDARRLANSGDLEGATAKYLSVWQSTREPQGLRRVPFCADHDDVRTLLSKYEPAQTSFTRIRDELTAIVEKDARCTSYQLADWFLLNQMLDDNARTLAWFDRVKSPDVWKRWSGNGWAEHFMLKLLRESKRWPDLCLAVPDPLESLQAARRTIPDFDRAFGATSPERRRFEQITADSLCQNSPAFYLGYLVVGNENKADQYAKEVGQWPGSSEALVGMVRLSIDEKVARASQLAILDDAEAHGANVKEVRARLETALAEKK